MKRYVHASTDSIDFTKKIPLDKKWYEWAGSDDNDYVIERLEDNGYEVVDTLGEACQLYYETADNLEEALRYIDNAWGNSVGVIPLANYDWGDQQDIYREWLYKYHPDEIDDI